jgi:RNA polymerase sigma-70 factor (ECF subfamily)
MVAVLTRIFGSHNLELAEDVVQDTLLTALEQWKYKGIPDKPEDWLFVVAKNKALNLIRKQKTSTLFGDEQTNPLLQSGYTVSYAFEQLASEELIKDDQLRMMFACCHPDIPEDGQVALILKTLCGFSIAEIARAFLSNTETISKRLYRARQAFKVNRIALNLPPAKALAERLQRVLKTIYLLLNEGYHSTHHEDVVRRDLIAEAFRLCYFLTSNEATRQPQVYAVLALICFHAARVEGRTDEAGQIILLDEQDRGLWDHELIAMGMGFLDSSARGEMSVYHLEAAIAAEHCKAANIDATDWRAILKYYELLMGLTPSPIVALNRAIVIAQLDGAAEGMRALEAIEDKAELLKYPLYHATRGELLRREGRDGEALEAYKEALLFIQNPMERRLVENKILVCGGKV